MLSSIIDIANEAVQFWEPTKRHASYFIHYKRYIRDLNAHVESLEAKKNDRQTQANEVGRVPSEEFKCWLKKVEEVQKIAEEMANKVGGEREQCLTWFSDLGSRYSLGKKATKKKDLIDELLKEMLDNISMPAPTQVIKSLINKDFKVYQSTDFALQKVMDALQNDGVHIIGLYGMGGVGKTTLAKEIKRRALEQNMFKKAITVTISQNPNLAIIREKMAEQLGINIKQESVSSEKLFSLIKQVGQVLIILDDMWKSLDLSDIGIPPDCCKIILTSRNVEVCKSMRSKEIIQLGVLSPKDSWEMFKEYSEVVESSSELQCLVARDVASECKGLPLAIATVGRALRGKSLPEWEDALVQLRASVPDNISELKDVYMQLKLSYDHLSKEAQSCFLLCSLFPEDDEISVELLTWYAMGEGFLQCVNTLQETKNRVLSLVNKLKASCLLLAEGGRGKMVKMHDVVRDVAIYIGSNENHEGCLSKSYQNEPDWDKWETVKECKRLSVMSKSICTLPEKSPKCSHMQTLLLQLNLELKKIPDKFFEKMTSLRVLDLSRTSISSLPASMRYLTNLQVILLDHCFNLKDISALGSQNKLQVLSLRSTRLKELSKVVGKFTGLKYLDLRNIYRLRIPPKVISNLCQLEELHVGDSFTKWEVGGGETEENAHLHEIQSLIKLKVLSIKVDKYWEDMLDKEMELETFDIIVGQITMTHHWNFQERASLRVNLSNLGLPGWVSVLLHKIEKLNLVKSSCPQLDATGGGGLQCMKFLELNECKEMEFIVIGQNRSSIPCIILPRLKGLYLKDMEKLRGICSSPLPNGSLEDLETLVLEKCKEMEFIVIGQNSSSIPCIILPHLKRLYLKDMEKLTGICSSPLPNGSMEELELLQLDKCKEMEFIIIGQNSSSIPCTILPRLKRLHLNDMEKLRGICSSPLPNGSLEELKVLKVCHCSILNINQILQQSTSVEELDISSQDSMIEIFSTCSASIILPLLKRLHLRNMEKLTSICSSPLPNGSLEELELLLVDDCSKLNIHQILQQSTSLEELYIWRQDSMREVFSTCSACRALLLRLRCMNLSYLPELMSIWKGDSVPPLGSFSNLIELKLIECNQLKYALSPNLAQRLESLEDLHVKDCNMMKGLISPSFHGFCNLRILTIENCSGFIHLFLLRVAQSLVELESLYIEGCEHMEVIVRGEEGEAGSERIFPRLQEVRLTWLPNLTSFCSVVGAGQAFAPVLLLPSLSKVYVFDCPRLTRLPLGSHSSPNLEKIEGEKEWLEGLVWDDEESKTRFIPLL